MHWLALAILVIAGCVVGCRIADELAYDTLAPMLDLGGEGR